MGKSSLLHNLIWASVTTIFFFTACSNNINLPLKQKQPLNQTEGVKIMAASIARDLSVEGPKAWLHYFATTPRFFMASDGKLMFRNNKEAIDFINDTLAKNFRKIELQWSDIRVDSLAPATAMLAASFSEVFTGFKKNNLRVNGYFTGLLEHKTQGWQLCNLHWSIEKK